MEDVWGRRDGRERPPGSQRPDQPRRDGRGDGTVRVWQDHVLEPLFRAGLGLAIGTSLGIGIVYDLSIGPTAAASGVSFFAVPVLNIVIIRVAADALAMLAIALASLRASRTPPAEAVRATESAGGAARTTSNTPGPRLPWPVPPPGPAAPTSGSEISDGRTAAASPR